MSISRSSEMEEVASWSELNEWKSDLEMEHLINQLKLDTADSAVSTGDDYKHGVKFSPVKGTLDDHEVAELVWARRYFFGAYCGTSVDQAYTQGRVDTNARMQIESDIQINKVGSEVVTDPGDDAQGNLTDTAWNANHEYVARYNGIDRVEGRVHSSREDSTAGAGHSAEYVTKGTGPIINYREMGDSDYGPIFTPDDGISLFGNIKVDDGGGGAIEWKYAIQVAWDVWEAEQKDFQDMRKVV